MNPDQLARAIAVYQSLADSANALGYQQQHDWATVQMERLREELFILLKPRIMALARRLEPVTSPAGHDTDDLCQLAYFKYIEVVPFRYDPDRGPGVWPFLHRVLSYFFVGLGRRGNLFQGPEGLTEYMLVDDSPERSLQELVSELSSQIELAFAGLADYKRKAFMLYWFGDLKQAQVARKFNRSVKTINSWVNEALDALICQVRHSQLGPEDFFRDPLHRPICRRYQPHHVVTRDRASLEESV